MAPRPEATPRFGRGGGGREVEGDPNAARHRVVTAQRRTEGPLPYRDGRRFIEIGSAEVTTSTCDHVAVGIDGDREHDVGVLGLRQGRNADRPRRRA